MNHTPEPWDVRSPNWAASHGMIVGSDGKAGRPIIAHTVSIENDEANAKRIVECVNACAGIENPKEIQSTIRAFSQLICDLEYNDWTDEPSFKEARDALASLCRLQPMSKPKWTEFQQYIKAGYSGIYIVSYEEQRVFLDILNDSEKFEMD